MKRKKAERSRGRRILRGCVLAAVCYVLFSLAATPVVLRFVFPRRETAEAFPIPEARQVSVPSDGGNLQGWVLDAEDPAGVALLLHGVRSSAADLTTAAEAFRRMGWTAVSINTHGVGGSAGTWTAGLQQALPDGRTALAWIAEQPEWNGLPVAVYGHSAGAWAAAVLSGESTVSGVICIAGFDRPVTMMIDRAARYTGPLAWLEEPFLRLWEAVLFGGEADASGAEALAESGKPALVVHGSEDRTVPQELSLYAGCDVPGSGVTALLIRDAGHAGDILGEAVPEEAIRGILEACAQQDK